VVFLPGSDNFTDKDDIKMYTGFELISIRQYVECKPFGRNSDMVKITELNGIKYILHDNCAASFVNL